MASTSLFQIHILIFISFRYWPSIAHAGSMYEVNSDLQGQECYSLCDIQPLGSILSTTTSTVISRFFIYIYFAISRNFLLLLNIGGFDLSWRNRKSSWHCLSDTETSSRIVRRNWTESFYLYLGRYTFWNFWLRIRKLL